MNDARERAELRTILLESFGANDAPTVADEWIDRMGIENVRVVRDGATVVAGLALLPMAQFFGGVPVRSSGIHAVAIDPGYRGRGVARELMRNALAESRASGAPLSTLFASTYALYRSVGYERAGATFRASVDLARIGSSRTAARHLSVRREAEGDQAQITELYREQAHARNGFLERGAFAWDRITRPARIQALHSWVVVRDRAIVGSVRWYHGPSPSKGKPAGSYYDLEIIDLVAADAEVVARILTLVADHGSLGGRAHWTSGPDDPFLLALPDRWFELALVDCWMLRLVDVEGALLARGWPKAVSGRLHLSVSDDVLPQNAKAFVLELAGGKASIEPGGDGSLKLTSRALAGLYSGYLSPTALHACGWLDGSLDQRELAAACFAGPLPWFRDRF